MHIAYGITSSFSEPSMSFCLSCGLWPACVTVWSCHANPNPSSKNRNAVKWIKRKEKRIEKLSPLLAILTFISIVLSEISSLVILNNPNCSDNTFILFSWCWFILLFVSYATSISYLSNSLKPYNIPVAWPQCTLLLQDEPDNALPNITIFSLA